MVELRIQDLLVGHTYRSFKRNFVGKIIEATPVDNFYDTYTFRIRIRENDYPTYHYAIVKVEVN
jgi:hypothetical protein